MAQNFQSQINRGLSDVDTIQNRVVNPHIQLEQFMQDMQNSGYLQKPQDMPRQSNWKPALIGAGLGTAIGALAGYGMSDALTGGLIGGVSGYTAANKKRNDYLKKTQDNNMELLKTIAPHLYDPTPQATGLQTLSKTLGNYGQMQSDKTWAIF